MFRPDVAACAASKAEMVWCVRGTMASTRLGAGRRGGGSDSAGEVVDSEARSDTQVWRRRRS